ncbi:MAG: KTSC domain-containing protein [Fusobacteriaceae bacterium]
MREIKIIDSSNIKSVFYELKTKELFVFFNASSLYVYEEVEDKDVDELSKEFGSKYFYDSIREKKKYKKRY